MEYLSVAEMAKKWGISERTVRNYCAHGKINGAFLTGKTWNIPNGSTKPTREKKIEKTDNELLNVLRKENIEIWNFCDNRKDADKLFDLVEKGIKTATSYLLTNNFKYDIGRISILTNWNKSRRLLLKTTKQNIVCFNDVPEWQALKEGEGDKSLSYWKKIHLKFFRKECKKFNKKFKIICEEFEVVKEI